MQKSFPANFPYLHLQMNIILRELSISPKLNLPFPSRIPALATSWLTLIPQRYGEVEPCIYKPPCETHGRFQACRAQPDTEASFIVFFSLGSSALVITRAWESASALHQNNMIHICYMLA